MKEEEKKEDAIKTNIEGNEEAQAPAREEQETAQPSTVISAPQQDMKPIKVFSKFICRFISFQLFTLGEATSKAISECLSANAADGYKLIASHATDKGIFLIMER